MKKIVVLLTLSACLVAFLLCLPVFAKNSVVSVKTIKAGESEKYDDYYVTGKMVEQTKKDVYEKLPLVASKVYVKVGDKVEPGDTLALIDKQATIAAIASIAQNITSIPKAYVDAVGTALSVYSDIGEYENMIPTMVSATTSGTITSLNIETGSICMPTSPICTIASSDKLFARFNIDELNAEKIRIGDTVVFKAGATGDEKYKATILQINPAATQTISGTSAQTVVTFVSGLSAQSDHLKSGYTINGVVRRKYNEKRLVLPYESIGQDTNNKEYVYIVTKNIAKKKYIETGEELSNGVEITKGISDKDIIVKNASSIAGDECIIKINN